MGRGSRPGESCTVGAPLRRTPSPIVIDTDITTLGGYQFNADPMPEEKDLPQVDQATDALCEVCGRPVSAHKDEEPCDPSGNHRRNRKGEDDKAINAKNLLYGKRNSGGGPSSPKPPSPSEPAHLRPDGTREWRNAKGELDRHDGPAVEFKSGRREWYKNGQLHRDDGPAITEEDGLKVWYRNGQKHRDDGPAIEAPGVIREWYQNDKLHREDGPAVERGMKGQWFIYGEEVPDPNANP